jgi:RNA polymerase sigma-70 factor, ECF subfamily
MSTFTSNRSSVIRRETTDVSAEAELVARCRAGDGAAFEELYRQHAGRLYNLAYRMSGGQADAEDLLQEIFMLAHRKLDSFRGQSSLGTWLYRLAMNLCVDHLRSRQTRSAALTDSIDASRVEPASPKYVAGMVNPTRLDLERAIARLPPGCREAFLLHDVEGFEHREIAEILGVAEGTSKSQVHKARMKLRMLLTGTTDTRE